MWNRLKAAVVLSAMCVLTTCQQAATLRITSPADGAVVNSGRTLLVTVEAPTGAFRAVSAVGGDPIGWADPLDSPPHRFSFQIPTNASTGPRSLTAIGVTATGQHAEFEIKVDIERPDLPTRIENDLPVLVVDVGHRSLLLITGTLADGSLVDLTYSSLTTYDSSNSAVAKVTPNGFVTAVGPGPAEITITNNGASVVVPIKVAKPR